MLEASQAQIATNNWGLEVKFLGIKKLQLPEGVSKTVFDRMQAERKVLADASTYEGEKEAARFDSLIGICFFATPPVIDATRVRENWFLAAFTMGG